MSGLFDLNSGVCQPFFPQQFLYFFPLPHGQGSFLPGCLPFTTGWLLFMPATKSIVCKDGTLNDITVCPSWLVMAKSPFVITFMPISIPTLLSAESSSHSVTSVRRVMSRLFRVKVMWVRRKPRGNGMSVCRLFPPHCTPG